MLTQTYLSDSILSEIDPLCIPLVRLFNDIGLKTVYSCQGHKNKKDKENFKFWIMFDNTIEDEDIISFLQKMTTPSKYYPSLTTTLAGNFYKWIRIAGENELLINWMYECDYRKVRTNQKVAAADFKRMVKILKKDSK